MNRLIIIGNGFDLAHGLKSKYSDFIEYYWLNALNGFDKQDLILLDQTSHNLNGCKSLNEILKQFEKPSGFQIRENIEGVYDLVHSTGRGQEVLRFKNNLFYKLNKRHNIQDWVDFEEFYFDKIRDFLRKEGDVLSTQTIEKVKQLNDEFNQIIKLFELYLTMAVEPRIANNNSKVISELFENPIVIKRNEDVHIRALLNDFPQKRHVLISDSYRRGMPGSNLFDSTVILNFNYTSTHERYSGNATVINIHGQINSDDEPINMGFGDESNELYQRMENYNNKDLLRFVKSFYYLNNSNYRKLMDFVESGPFQCQIMGHSCGLSDRTLLRAIFEDRNCQSIKPFYYTIDELTNKDNYIDLVQNISRHFGNKVIMREKIVNKRFCKQIPQFKS